MVGVGEVPRQRSRPQAVEESHRSVQALEVAVEVVVREDKAHHMDLQGCAEVGCCDVGSCLDGRTDRQRVEARMGQLACHLERRQLAHHFV